MSELTLSRDQVIATLQMHRPDLVEGKDLDAMREAELLTLLDMALAPRPGLELLPPHVTDQPSDIDLDGLVRDAGLIYRDHRKVIMNRPDGTQGPVWVPTERPMTGADVLSWHVEGDTVIIVTGDGQKLRFTGPGQVVNLLEG